LSDGYSRPDQRGLQLCLICVATSAIAIGLGRWADLMYAALIAVPLAGLAGLLYAPPVVAFCAEAALVVALPAVGAFVGGPAIGVAVGIGVMGIAYWPRWPGFESRHRVGLSMMIAVIIVAAHVIAAGSTPAATGGEDAFTIWLKFTWLLPALFICIGWPLRRDLRSALARLGLVWPTPRIFGAAVAIGLALVPIMLGLSALTAAAFEAAGWPTTSTDDVRLVFAELMTPMGIVIIALTAGIGEEILVRGVLQPRFGLVLPAVFFTALHAGQYRLDALLALLCLSVVLGLMRRRWHTTACVVAHVVYDLGIGWTLIH
jgi:membrane protease YdiL (CAAX protease family)